MEATVSSRAVMIVAVLVFVAVLLFVESAYLLWSSYHGPEIRKIEKRLQALSAARDNSGMTRALKQRMLSEVPTFNGLLARLPHIHRLDRFILQSGLDWTVFRLMLSCILSAMCALLILKDLTQLAPLSLACGSAAASALPLLYVNYRRRRRLDLFQRQLADAVDLVVRALRSGHAFAAALKMVSDEMPAPLAEEFGIVHDEVNFGISLTQSLTNLSERVPLTDLRYFVVSALIQRESGGNMTEVLGNLSRLIRERLKLVSQVQVLSAEGRMSAWVLSIMPFALAGLLFLFNPAFMSPLWTDPMGIRIIEYLLGSMAVGLVVLRMITHIRV